MSKKSKSIVIFLLLFTPFITALIVVGDEIPKTNGSLPMQNLTIDGVINEAEWADSDWNVSFYLNIDDVGNPPDTDGYNYMYLGEDVSNLYIGLDLCSDQTGSTNGEWVGVWLNTINRSFSNSIEWANYLDNGTEALVYDVENNKEWDFLSNSIGGFQTNIIDESDYTATYGTISGDLTSLESPLDGNYFNVTAELIGGNYTSWIEFTIDLKEYYSIFKDIFPYNIQWFKIQIHSEANETINEHKVFLAYNDGAINPNDPDQTRLLSTTTSQEDLQFTCQKDNISDNREIKFILYANNSNPFKTLIDNIWITLYNNMSNYVATVTYPYTSVNNYDVEWSFGPSPNNASDHRMYEIKIPKSELTHYNADEELGIIVGGYGTMSFPGSNYWVFSTTDLYIQEQISTSYLYYDMKGCQAPPNGFPDIWIYIIIIVSVIGIVAVVSFILIRRRSSK